MQQKSAEKTGEDQEMSEKDIMRIGKITQTAWRRSVRKHLHIGDGDMLFALSPWETCSGFQTETGDGYVWADAHVSGDDAGTGYYAVYHAAGELAARNVRARGAAVYVMLAQGSREEQLAGIAAGVDRACRELEIPVTDFQGEVSGAVVHTVVTVSAAGVRQDQRTQQGQELLHGQELLQGQSPQKTTAANSVKAFRREAAAQREIIMCGYAGLEGTLRILDEAQAELETRFVSAFLEQTKGLTVELASPGQILKVFESDRNASVRQIGSGGIMAALWELSETAGIGFEIDMPQIALKQETVEICEFYRLNPYLMTSAGSYLILTDAGEAVIRALEETGAHAVRLGAARDQNARVIQNGEEIRYLDRPAPDELEIWRSKR